MPLDGLFGLLARPSCFGRACSESMLWRARSGFEDAVCILGGVKPKPTRTVGPLHFDDLDPHRFEDLVRQLAYGFRRWAVLEAVGRSGDDEGVDIRGVEVDQGTGEVGYADNEVDGQMRDLEGSPGQRLDAARTWFIQVKRTTQLGPAKARKVAAEAVFDEVAPPYGFILAASADVSRRAREALARDLRSRGVRQVIVWGRGELEDMLFDPRYDHLLFGYFGISLQVRRRNLAGELRQRLTKKRQIFSALGDLKNRRPVNVLLRDPVVGGYPFRERVEDFDSADPPWIETAFRSHSNPDMVCLTFRRHHAWLSPDRKSYDVLDACSHIGTHRRKDDDPDHDKELCERISRYCLTEVPDGENAWLEFLGWIPFDDILLVDDLGDAFHDPPHLLVTRDHPSGFFTHVRAHVRVERARTSLRAPEAPVLLDELTRVQYFPDPLPTLPAPALPGAAASEATVSEEH